MPGTLTKARFRDDGSFRPDMYFPGFASSGVAKRGMELVDLRSLGILPGVAGGSRGYNTEGDVITQTTDGRDLNEIWAEFQAAIAIQNEARQRIIDLLTFTVTQLIETVPQFTTDDFEEASEFGEPKSIRTQAGYFNMSYDWKWYDVAARFTWKYLAEATAAQVESVHQSVLEADNRNVFSKVMRTIFNPVNLAATIQGQAYTVYKLYNADGTVPPTYLTNVFDGTHTHYFTSGAAAVTSGDLDDVIEHLEHHGYSQSNGHQMIIMVNRNEGKVIRGFRSAVNGGTASFDFIPAQGTPAFILPNGSQILSGGQPVNEFQGLTVIGSYGSALIVQEDYIPVGYILGFATGGGNLPTNLIGLREHANPALRGLRLIPGNRSAYPLVDSFYSRGFGTGIRQRGAAAVMQITANANYAAPAAYL